MTPPRARGSTSESCLRSYNAGDSPAYAGIDPHEYADRARTGGLPRVRGDAWLIPNALRVNPLNGKGPLAKMILRPAIRDARPGEDDVDIDAKARRSDVDRG